MHGAEQTPPPPAVAPAAVVPAVGVGLLVARPATVGPAAGVELLVARQWNVWTPLAEQPHPCTQLSRGSPHAE